MSLLLASCLIMVQGQEFKTLIPDSGEIPGWNMATPAEIYVGDNLFELINGGADIYLEYGFIQVLSVQYSGPSMMNVQVEIYEMEDPPSAYGIFSISRSALEWAKKVGWLSVTDNNYVSFYKSRFFVTISFISGQIYDQDQLQHFAENISGKLPDTGLIPLLVEKFGDFSSNKRIIYFNGNIALSNFYYFDYKDIFNVEEAVAGEESGYRWVIINYKDQAGAKQVITGAKERIANIKRYSDIAMAYEGFSCLDNKGNRLLFKQTGHYIVILIAKDPAIQLAPLMDSYSLKLEKS